MYPNRKRPYQKSTLQASPSTPKSRQEYSPKTQKIEKTIECLCITSEEGTPLILEPIGTTIKGYTMYVARAPEPGEEADIQQAQGQPTKESGASVALPGA